MPDSISVYSFEDLKTLVGPLDWEVQKLESRSTLADFTQAERDALRRARYALLAAFQEGGMALMQALRDRADDQGESLGDLAAEYHRLERRVDTLESTMASIISKLEGAPRE